MFINFKVQMINSAKIYLFNKNAIKLLENLCIHLICLIRMPNISTFEVVRLQSDSFGYKFYKQMFFWCCPKKRKKEGEVNLHQSLLQNNQSLLSTENDRNFNKQKQKETNHKWQQAIAQDTKSQSKTISVKQRQKQEERLTKTQSKISEQNMGVQPNFGRSENFRPFSPRDHDRGGPSLKKSHLWKQQLKSDLIYFNLTNTNYSYVSYRLTKNQETKDCINGLDYFLSKTKDKIHVIIGKQGMINGKLSTLNKYSDNIIIANYGKNSTEQNQNQTIILEDLKCIRWCGIDSIVLMTDALYNYDEVKLYFNMMIKYLGWEEIKKTTFIFPAFITLEELSQLLFSSMKQYVYNQSLQKISLDLAFDMELIQSSNLDSCIIIKSRSEETKLSNSIYDHLKLSIAFFAKDLCSLTQKLFRDFYIQTRQKPLKQYFNLKQFYKRNPVQFRSKVKQMKVYEPKVWTDLESTPNIKQYLCDDEGFYYVIQSKVREDIGRIFNIVELQKNDLGSPVKKEWDDDATVDDFKTIRSSKLDMVAKSQLDQIDLDLGLGDDDNEDQFLGKTQQDYEDQEIVLKMQEHSPTAKSRDEEPGQKQKNTKERQEAYRCEGNHRYNRFE